MDNSISRQHYRYEALVLSIIIFSVWCFACLSFQHHENSKQDSNRGDSEHLLGNSIENANSRDVYFIRFSNLYSFVQIKNKQQRLQNILPTISRDVSPSRRLNQPITDRHLEEITDSKNISFDVNDLLSSFTYDQENRKENGTTGDDPNNQTDDYDTTSAVDIVDVSEMRTSMVLSQNSSCSKLNETTQGGRVHFKTSYFLKMHYEYLIAAEAQDQQQEPDKMVSVVNKAVQNYLIDSYILPYCNEFSKKHQMQNDFRRLRESFSYGTSDPGFAQYIRGIGLDNEMNIQNKSIHTCPHETTCYSATSSNLIYLDDTLRENDIFHLNEDMVREAVLTSISEAFTNGTILHYYNKILEQSNGNPLRALQFSRGYSDQIVVNGDNASFLSDSTKNNNKLLIIDMKSSIVIIFLVFSGILVLISVFVLVMVVRYKEVPHAVTIRSDMASTISLQTSGGSRFSTDRKKIGFLSSKNTSYDGRLHRQYVASFFRDIISQVRLRKEINKNKRKGVIMLRDDKDQIFMDPYDGCANQTIIFNKATMETACTASFDDEIGMEMLLYHLELDESNGECINQSSLFDPDVFASMKYHADPFQTNEGNLYSESAFKSDMMNALRRSTNYNKKPTIQKQIQLLERDDQNRSEEISVYYSGDEELPFDVGRMLCSREITECNSTFDEFSINGSINDSDNTNASSFMADMNVALDDSNSINTNSSKLDKKSAAQDASTPSAETHFCESNSGKSATSSGSIEVTPTKNQTLLWGVSDTVDL